MSDLLTVLKPHQLLFFVSYYHHLGNKDKLFDVAFAATPPPSSASFQSASRTLDFQYSSSQCFWLHLRSSVLLRHLRSPPVPLGALTCRNPIEDSHVPAHGCTAPGALLEAPAVASVRTTGRGCCRPRPGSRARYAAPTVRPCVPRVRRRSPTSARRRSTPGRSSALRPLPGRRPVGMRAPHDGRDACVPYRVQWRL